MRSGLVHARRDILAILPAISQESYTRAYPQLAKLAMLQELEVGSCVCVHACACACVFS